MPLVDWNQVVQAITPDRPDQRFTIGIRFRRVLRVLTPKLFTVWSTRGENMLVS